MSGQAEDIERERRQLMLMSERIDQFRTGTLSLFKLISNLEALLGARTHASVEWIEAFRSAWVDLQIAYAAALDLGKRIPDVHDPDVSDAVWDLELLIGRATDDLC